MKKLFFVIVIATIAVSTNAFAGPNYMTDKEKQLACKAMIDSLDYDEGNSIPLCISGRWIISDIEEGRGNRQVAFNWTGRLSNLQGAVDQCDGYVFTGSGTRGRKSMKVLDLSCKRTQ